MGAPWEPLAKLLPLTALLLPLVGAALITATSGLGLTVTRRIALGTVFATLVVACAIVANYDVEEARTSRADTFQMVTSFRFSGATAVANIDIVFGTGIDGVSIWFVLLAASLALPAVLAGVEVDRKNAAAFYTLLLALESTTIGVFVTLDVVSFAIYIEAAIVILFYLIGRWGGYDRHQAARKLLIYNLCGSFCLLAGLTTLVLAYRAMTACSDPSMSQLTTSIPRLIAEIPITARLDTAAHEYWRRSAPWIFSVLAVALAIRTPIIPFHTWMPGASHEAPAAVSILLVGVALKLGFYGFVRLIIPLFPELLSEWSGTFIPLAVLGGIFAAFITLGHDDMKRVVTYSALVTMELCIASVLVLSSSGIVAAALLSICHGFAAGGLLYLIGEIDRQYQTREVEAFGGLYARFPRWCAAFVFFAFSTIGIPGFASFPGYWLGSAAMFQSSRAALSGMLMASLFVTWALLLLMHRLMLGKFRVPFAGDSFLEALSSHGARQESPRKSIGAAILHDESERSLNAGAARVLPEPRDLGPREFVALAPLAIVLFAIGLWPRFVIDRMEPAVRQMLSRANAAISADDGEATPKAEPKPESTAKSLR